MKSIPRAARKVTKGSALLFFTAALLVTNPVLAQELKSPPESSEPTAAAAVMAKTMDPNSWALMMTMAMDPRTWMNPISSCTACHDNEDVGRYQQVLGPFVSMMNPAMWSNPEIYNSMIANAMDAKAAEQWQRAVAKKYGLKPGDPMPAMHAWPMVPAFPVPIPAPTPKQ